MHAYTSLLPFLCISSGLWREIHIEQQCRSRVHGLLWLLFVIYLLFLLGGDTITPISTRLLGSNVCKCLN